LEFAFDAQSTAQGMHPQVSQEDCASAANQPHQPSTKAGQDEEEQKQSHPEGKKPWVEIEIDLTIKTIGALIAHYLTR
jgi:hypothetical protein